MTRSLRSLPSVDSVLSDQRIKALAEAYSHQAMLGLVRERLEAVRAGVTNGAEAPTFDELVLSVERTAATRWAQWPRHAINATGVILHTNLGRAPLSAAAAAAAQRAALGYSDLELDLKTGARGSRQAYISRLLCQITGAEAGIVVNNNASAVLLGLAAVARGKEVIVSRGEAIEIGGGFRIPDVLRQSGATLVEVGTTNRTYVKDYEAAISESTGAVLLAHASNFRVTGFTHSPELAELVALGGRRDVPVLHDLGSGCLLDTAQFGLAHEPMPQESVASGVGLAFFSGDKLLGGPQAGIIVGKGDLVETAARHPLARAMRIDKLSMAALAETLLHYVREEASEEIPVWRMISRSEDEIRSAAEGWSERLGPAATVGQGLSAIGGGSLPGETLPTWVVSIDPTGVDSAAEGLARLLREADPPVLGRIEDGRVLLDPRTVLPAEEHPLLHAVRGALKASE